MSATLTTAQITANLNKLAEWDGAPDVTPELVATFSDPQLAMVWGMMESRWTKYQESQSYKDKAQAEWDAHVKSKWGDEDEDEDDDGNPSPDRLTALLIAKYPPQLVYDIIQDYKRKWIADAEAKHKPQPKVTKKAGGKRTSFNGDDVIEGYSWGVAETTPPYSTDANSPFQKALKSHGASVVEAQKNDTDKFWFEGDEEVFYAKPTQNKAKTTRTWVCHPVKRNISFGSDGDQDDDICNGALGWDKAGSSKAISNTGLGGSAFKMRCGSKAEEGGFCAGCVKKKAPNFFTDTYKITKGSGAKYNGKTYYKFITEKLIEVSS